LLAGRVDISSTRIVRAGGAGSRPGACPDAPGFVVNDPVVDFLPVPLVLLFVVPAAEEPDEVLIGTDFFGAYYLDLNRLASSCEISSRFSWVKSSWQF
jgi:hypothetical protein